MKDLITSDVFYEFLKLYCEEKNIPVPTKDILEKILVYKKVPIDKNVTEEVPEILDNYETTIDGIRTVVRYLLEKIFDVMLIERDTNTYDTPKRVAKLLVSDMHTDDELLSGRWCIKPSLTTFNNHEDDHYTEHDLLDNTDFPLVKVKINLYSLCSHHLLPFGTINSEPSVHIVYIVNKIYPGLSKIGRLVNYISRRGWMQENLTKVIADTLYQEFMLKGVVVSLSNIVHTCSVHRGYSDDMEMETMYYNGVFKKDKKLLEHAIKIIKE